MATKVIDRDRFQNLFEKLETEKTLLTSCTQLWKNLSNHFSSLEESLLQKSKSLDSKLETLESDTKKTLESLDHRQNSIPERESAAATHVEEQKQAALLEFENPSSANLEFAEALRSCCRKMDAAELLRFMLAKRKETVALRSEISLAIAVSVDPPRLVLDALEDYISHKSVKIGVSDRRWACGMLLQSLFPDSDLEGKLVGVSGSIAERAGSIASSWKLKIDEKEGGEIGPAEAAMFLQIVVGFGLTSRFEEEFLKKLVLGFPSRREMPKLAAKLGFGEKMGDLIDELVKSGKVTEAVYFAYESGLTERFPPVSLLNTYLKKSRKNANTILRNGNYNMAATEEANALELNSIKAIIKCIEDHKLESQFALEWLRKRASQLEKSKVHIKKNAPAAHKPQNKRARGGGGGGGGGPGGFRSAKAGRVSNAYSSYGRRNPAPAHQNPGLPHQNPVAGYPGPYNYPNQAVYEGPSSTSYAPPYGGGVHSRSPAAPPQHYYSTDMGVGGTRTGGSYGAQSSYGAYDYTGAPAPAAFQPPYAQ